jgi:hypothetical protein
MQIYVGTQAENKRYQQLRKANNLAEEKSYSEAMGDWGPWEPFGYSITSTSYAQAHTKGREVALRTPALKPGDYVWHPEVSPAGPVVILVSVPDQL